MNPQLQQYFSLKQTLKEHSKALKELLLQDPEYNNFSADLTASREVLKNCRDNLVKDSPSIGSANNKVVKIRQELKTIKEAIQQSLKVVDNEGQVVQLKFSF